MMSLSAKHGLLFLILLSMSVSQAWAAKTRTVTIHVDNMHCAHCARKIAGKLYAVPAVVAVKTNVPASTALVFPQANRDPSPRALWEAVEKAGFKPVKLEAPSGTYGSKPPR
jgi:copper chaperone CopZ